MKYDEIIKQLKDLNADIKTNFENIIKSRLVVEEIKDQMKLREAQVIIEVSETKDIAGKPKYTNEASRQSELIVRLFVDEEYKQLKTKLKQERVVEESEEVELNYKKREFSILIESLKLLNKEEEK